MQDQIKPWRCAGGHILGQVVRNGRGIRQLLLYRRAVDPEAEPEDVDVIAVVEGLALDVACSVCGMPRTWVPGEEAMRRLLESVRRERD